MKTILPDISLALLLVTQVTATISRGDTLVVPNDAKDADGFGAGITFLEGARIQSIYNPSQFLSAMPEGGIITQIAFRIDESERDSLSAVIPNVEIHMSTSPAIAGHLSVSFSANVGPDETVVFPTHSLSVTIAGSKSGPNPFQIVFPLQTPFMYDPRQGSLCIDVFSHNSATGRLLLDAGGAESDALQGPIGLSTGFGSNALVTQITFQPVPEATIPTILSLGAVLVATTRASKVDARNETCMTEI